MRPPTSLQPSNALLQTISSSMLVRFILLFVCGWIGVLIINYFYATIALFTAAGIFAALLNYPVIWLSRYIPRGWAIAITFIGALALLLGLFTVIGLQVMMQGQALLTQIGEALNQHDTRPFQNFLNKFDINNAIETLQSSLATGLGLVRSIFSSIFVLVFGAVICLYMLIDGEKLWQLFLNRLPIASRDRFSRIFQMSFLGFIRGQLLLMLFLSTTTLITYPLLGVNFALILAVIIGLIDAIPGIGATLGVIVVTFLVFASQGAAVALRVLAVSIVLIQIQDNYVRPRVMGRALELNPVLLFLALFIGERVAGLLGVFLSIPLAGMISLWMQSESEKTEIALEESPEQN